MAENGGFINIRLVQTLSLVAVYELGHGIYPAAYLTIGRAVRLATMIGLQSQIHAKQLFTGADTWTLCEEQRRTWWTVLMLDRYGPCANISPSLSSSNMSNIRIV